VALTLTDVSEISDARSRRHVLAIIRDVTDVRRAERELKEANRVREEFMATASHDLRSPLTAVLGFSRLLVESGADVSEEKRLEFAHAIDRGATRAVRLIEDLLTISQIQSGIIAARQEELWVAQAASEAVLQAKSAATVHVDEGLAVSADPDHLERILVNYLVNAGRYGAPPVTVSAVAGPRGVRIRVCDAGSGVPEELQARLFTSFVGANPSVRESTGLGLSIVKGLALANGGDVFYEKADTGCCFGITLPLLSRSGPQTASGQRA